MTMNQTKRQTFLVEETGLNSGYIFWKFLLSCPFELCPLQKLIMLIMGLTVFNSCGGGGVFLRGDAISLPAALSFIHSF